MYYVFGESCLLVLLVYFLFYFIYYKDLKNIECISSYECGFDSKSQTRSTFSYRFFLISILFLIFDVEISLMLPLPFLINSVFGVIIFMFFMMILILGLLYEYYYGSLDWLDNFVSKA